jgi:MSHA biogenesis protein MshP
MKQMTTMRYKLQQGFSLVTAIFLLVVLAGLGAVMMTFFTAQQQSSALDVMGARAYQASRAGIEWGAYQIIQSGVAGGAFASACQPGPVSSPVALTNTLSGFNLNVQCSATSHVEGTNQLWVYSVSSVAATGGAAGQPDYVERQMSVTVVQ